MIEKENIFFRKMFIVTEYAALRVTSFFASGDFRKMLIQITFANSLSPDQDRHSVGPDLDPNCLTI